MGGGRGCLLGCGGPRARTVGGPHGPRSPSTTHARGRAARRGRGGPSAMGHRAARRQRTRTREAKLKWMKERLSPPVNEATMNSWRRGRHFRRATTMASVACWRVAPESSVAPRRADATRRGAQPAVDPRRAARVWRRRERRASPGPDREGLRRRRGRFIHGRADGGSDKALRPTSEECPFCRDAPVENGSKCLGICRNPQNVPGPLVHPHEMQDAADAVRLQINALRENNGR